MADKELLEKTSKRLRVIADDTQRITSGNISHNLTCLRGFALRAAESIERHLQEPVSEDERVELLNYLYDVHDEKHNLTDFERTLADICIGWIGEEPGWKEYIKDNADVLLKIAIEKFNSVQDVPFEQSPTWSEEDEKILNLIIARLHSHSNVEAEEYGKDYHWLKSLKDRVQPQPKQEWSEEDECNMRRIIRVLEDNDSDWNELTDWLKSLRPQNKWKPSDEQIMALRWVLNNVPYNKHKEEISGLLDQIKDL